MEFDIDAFRAIYPQFQTIPDATLEFMWENALFLSGIETDSRIPADKKQNLLFMLLCHMVTLAMRGTAGALASATEGSVSASFQVLQGKGEDADWYNLTPCGSVYWQTIKRYRLGGLWFKGRKSIP